MPHGVLCSRHTGAHKVGAKFDEHPNLNPGAQVGYVGSEIDRKERDCLYDRCDDTTLKVSLRK